MIHRVQLSKQAKADLKKAQPHVQRKLKIWLALVQHQGLELTRLIKGFHDEPLKGKRAGQRSIRLNKSYRAIYLVKKGLVEFVNVEEIHKHAY